MKVHGGKVIFNIDDFAKDAPSFGYSRVLNKVVFKNYEAFWLCAVAAEQPHVLDGVAFRCDDEFKRQVSETTGKNIPSQKDIQSYLSKQLAEAMAINDTLRDDDIYKCFRVEASDPNDIEKMGAFKSKGKLELGKDWKKKKIIDLGEDGVQ